MEKADKEIRILDTGNVELDPCPVSKAHNDRVRWVSDVGPWTITFQNAPFTPNTFTIAGSNGGKSGWSGNITGDVGKSYKYTVSGRGKTVDPNIIVK